MRFVIAVVAGLFGVTSALAADLPARMYSKAPVMVDPGYDWSGFYIGGNLGYSWGRSSDTIGVGGAINGLSSAHRDFLAAGGLGLLIGDGRLNYRPEQILETYYAFAIDKNFTVTADYQFITNPAYNADRGPVHIFSGRLHGEF